MAGLLILNTKAVTGPGGILRLTALASSLSPGSVQHSVCESESVKMLVGRCGTKTMHSLKEQYTTNERNLYGQL